jgi:hypothetical protein
MIRERALKVVLVLVGLLPSQNFVAFVGRWGPSSHPTPQSTAPGIHRAGYNFVGVGDKTSARHFDCRARS